MSKRKFAIFILSHGRAGNVKTLDTLGRCGYTGDWYILIDDEDGQRADYERLYGKEHIIVFCKAARAALCDSGESSGDRRVILFARNECFAQAKILGLTHFLELDDDYNEFRYRFEKDGRLSSAFVLDMNPVIEQCLNFLDESGAYTVAFAQGGDFAGGYDRDFYRNRVARKAMNAFFCRTDRPINFVGRLNEDVNTYLTEGARGHLFLTVANVSLHQAATQSGKGGMTDSYLVSGTYIKSFFSVMYAPSCVKVSSMMGGHEWHARLHHRIDWDSAAPKIVSERFRKQ